MDDAAEEQGMTGQVGAELRAARESRELSLVEIAERTRIPLRHLATIERGGVEGLPAATYSAGFIKTYARLLGLDGHDLSQRFRAELAERAPVTSHRQEPYAPADPARVPSRLLAWGALAVAVLLALGYLYWRGTRLSDNPSELAVRQEAPPAAPSSSVPAAVFQPGVAVPAPVPVPGQTALVTAEQPAWLRITDAGSGATLFQGILNPGDHFAVPATATDPRLRTSRATALQVTVGATTIPPLGPPETLVKDVSLKADALLARAGGATAPSR